MTADKIKIRLWACNTIEEVNSVVREVQGAVKEMTDTDPVAAIHIKNLAAYMRKAINEGWVSKLRR